MLSGLILTAFLMGVGGIPHCAAMCGAPCAVAFPRGLPLPSLLGRCLGYSVLGAVAAVSAGAMATWAREVAFLKPLWIMLLAAALMLGLYLAKSGRIPASVNNGATDLYRKVRVRWARSEPLHPAVKPLLPLFGGLAWVVMPCGLLYAALMVAVLAPHAWGGALVMLAFAIPGAFGVWAAPRVIRGMARFVRPRVFVHETANGQVLRPPQSIPITWMPREKGPESVPRIHAQAVTRIVSVPDHPPRTLSAPLAVFSASQFDPRWAVRVSGLLLAGMAGWALYHQLWAQWQIWCA